MSRLLRPRPLLLLLLLLRALPSAYAQESAAAAEEGTVEAATPGAGTSEWVVEFDPYYSSVGSNISLTGKPIPTITAASEGAIYRELIKDSLIPQYMLLEASVYPLPWFFTYIRSDAPDLYRQGEIGDSGINLFESATAGFQEPWALSAFFGNTAKLKRPGDTREGTNWGYTGYLISGGTKHIKRNRLIDDEWYEVEWKIKGKREYEDEKLDWSFRIGAKFNANDDVNDVNYIGIHRSKVDFRSSWLQWLENTNFDMRVHALQDGGQIVRVELIAGKNFPRPEWSIVPSLDVGFVITSPDEYSGELRDTRGDEVTLVLRPSFSF